MQVVDSIVEGILALPEPTCSMLIKAVTVYALRGTEPDNLDEDPNGVAEGFWVAILPVLSNSRKRTEAGRRGGSKQKPKQTPSKSEANAKQTAKQNESEEEEEEEEEDITRDTKTVSRVTRETDPLGEVAREHPSVSQVAEYLAASTLPPMEDPHRFVQWVEEKRVVDWKAAARSWVRREAVVNAEEVGSRAAIASEYAAYDRTNYVYEG